MALDNPAQGVEPQVVPPSDEVLDAIVHGAGALVTGEQQAVTEQELITRFSPERMKDLATQFLEEGTGENLKDKLNGRPFVVTYLHGESPYSDLARSVEQEVFSEAFGMPHTEVYEKYSLKDDATSVFACVIDTADPDNPKPVGALRMVGYNPEHGFKDLNALVVDEPFDTETMQGNPWLEEVKAKHFKAGEEYDPKLAIERIIEATGEELALEDTLDVTSHSAVKGFRGKNGALDSTSMLFFHACLDEALRQGKKNLVAIFDIGPFDNLQQFGEPFDTYDGLDRHPYDGPNDTQPAYCVIEKGVQRIEDFDQAVADTFVRGVGLDAMALMPKEQAAQRIF